ncbi:MAG: hypothetical protein AAGE03_14010 [Pseudomonadota bacterium]
MLAWDIFKKAVLLIVDNISGALRISAVPYALLAVVNLYFLDSVTASVILSTDTMPALNAGAAQAMFFNALVQIVVFLWIAVAWHRYVLLQEGGDGWIPAFQGGYMLGYLGRGILLGLIIAAVLVAIVVALGFIAPFFAVAVASIVSIILFYRLGLILPAGAVGKPITIGEAWTATEGQSATVVALALISFFASLLLQLPTILDGISSGAVDPAGDASQMLSAATSPVSLVYNLVVNWIVLLVGVSMLSTLYGHFVEGRPLD